MPPRVRVEVLSAQAESQPGRWRVSFKVDNLGDTPLALQSAWIPHGRFRGDGRLPLACQLAPGDSTRLEFGVTAQEPPGTRLDNAYLILQAASAGRGWRIFTRMRIAGSLRQAAHALYPPSCTQGGIEASRPVCPAV